MSNLSEKNNLNRKTTTKFLSDLLVSDKFGGMGKYWASEVTLDYGLGKGKGKRVDFMQFKPVNTYSISGIEKGIFICYEIKSCKADFHSGNGLNFEGEKNYLVVTMQTYKELINEITALPINVGVMIACPYNKELADEFENPTPIDSKNVSWTLKIIKHSYERTRKRSMNEMFFCMLRSGKER